jgi:hypothetical protein
VVVLAAVLGVAPAASATDVSGAELQRLAARAEHDPAALERLRGVDRVDGRPVDLETALRDAEGAELASRLRTLRSGGSAPGGSAASDPRGAARDVLAEGRFHQSKAFRPLRGVLDWLSGGVRRVGEAIGGVVSALADAVPGGGPVLWGLFAALVIAATAFLTSRVVRRRAGDVRASAAKPRADPALDPRRLEREAETAERRGELERAIRLRFRAGLLRLDRSKRISFRESITSREVSRRLRSPDFDRLARTFDEIVYGRRAPQPGDAASTRDGWARVLGAEAR